MASIHGREFVRRGGTVVVAEDFGGHTNRLLAAIGARARVDGRLLRDERHNYRSPNITVATGVRPNRTLTAGVDQLTLNHGSAVRPNGATPVVNSSGYGYLAAVLVTAGATLLPVVRDTPLRVVVGFPFLLFVPGYAFIAALFPEAGEPVRESSEADESDAATERWGIDGLERVALSFGTSIAIVPLVGLVLNFTPWGIRLVPIVVSVGGLTAVLAVVAGRRRLALPEGDRFTVPYGEWWRALRAELFAPETRTDAALNVLVVVSLLLAAGSVGYAVAVPKQGESFTEFYLLTENGDGELTADGYPTQLTEGEPTSLVVGIEN